jgi:hypothetical protein
MFRRITILVSWACIVLTASNVNAGSAVVTDGKFTNIYVYQPDSENETWEQHMAKLRRDADKFSRASIDRFTAELMRRQWPSYFDWLFQYGVHPPQFFGSAVASKECVKNALRDMHNGVLQWDTIRSLSNCHEPGRDPSPQVILIFSPDIKIGKIPGPLPYPLNPAGVAISPIGTTPDMCKNPDTHAWHASGLNTPNYIAMPTSPACVDSFDDFTHLMSHEIVETISDPGGMGMGDFGVNELCDNCEKLKDLDTRWKGFLVSRYWSNFDNDCEPRLEPPQGSQSETWILVPELPGGVSLPAVFQPRLTGDVHSFDWKVPSSRVTSAAIVTRAMLVIQTGKDDLRGGNDNANATLKFVGGSETKPNINSSRTWRNGETHAVALALPSTPLRVSDITGVTITTHFGGGSTGDNWNVRQIALVVSFSQESATVTPPPKIVHEWLNASGAPLVRFTGDLHDLFEGVRVPAQDVGKDVRALDLIISTGNDDLRGGSDNCDVIVQLASGEIRLPNVNAGKSWSNWSNHAVTIPLPSGGLKGGDIKAVRLHTEFGGSWNGDNWNVNRLQLRATF